MKIKRVNVVILVYHSSKNFLNKFEFLLNIFSLLCDVQK